MEKSSRIPKQLKLTAVLGLIIMLVSVLLTGCGNEQQAQTEAAAPTTTENSRTYPYTFTDMAGKQITLDKEVKTVYIAGSVQPLLPVYRYYAGNSTSLLQCPEASQNIIKSSIFSSIWPDICELQSHKEDVNTEEILALNPDVVFMTGNATGDSYESLVNAGLTVVTFTTAGSGYDTNTFAALEGWLKQMGEVFGNTGASDSLINYNNEELAKMDTKLAGISDEDKPEALIIFQLSDNTLKVAGSGHYSEFWLQHTGAVNAAKDVSKLQEVDIEQIMSWDPDIIYLTTFSTAMPDDLYNNTFEGFDFSQLSAVENQQVYKIPLGSYRWYAPSCECSLMLKWMATINQPVLCSDIDMNRETKDFFKKFYNTDLTDDQITTLLNPTDKTLMSH